METNTWIMFFKALFVKGYEKIARVWYIACVNEALALCFVSDVFELKTCESLCENEMGNKKMSACTVILV